MFFAFPSAGGLPQALFYAQKRQFWSKIVMSSIKNPFLYQKHFLHLSCHPPNGFWQLLRNLQHGPPGGYHGNFFSSVHCLYKRYFPKVSVVPGFTKANKIDAPMCLRFGKRTLHNVLWRIRWIWSNYNDVVATWWKRTKVEKSLFFQIKYLVVKPAPIRMIQ